MKVKMLSVAFLAIVLLMTTTAFDFSDTSGKFKKISMARTNIETNGNLDGVYNLLTAGQRCSAPTPFVKRSSKNEEKVQRTDPHGILLNTSTKINTTDACYSENKAFAVGEEITYKIYYNWGVMWIPAGEVIFKVEDNDNLFHITATGRTYSTYEWFFKVRDKYEVFVDKETLLPVTSIRNVREGGYKLYDKIEFDQAQNKLTSLRGKTKEKATLRAFDVEACIHDVLSIVYHARNIQFDNYAKGDEFPIKIFMDKEIWPLKVKYEGKQKGKKIKGRGRFNTVKFSPEVIVGDVFTEDAKMNIWVTDDANKIPLLIESPVSVGSIKVVLKDYKNLRHEMTSKAK